MAKRDILDYSGQVVGELELPDDTPDSVWEKKLASYITIPLSQTERYAAKLAKQKDLAPMVMASIRLYMIENVVSLADAADIYHQLAPELLAVQNGVFEIAIYMLQQHTPSGAVTQEFLDACVAAIRSSVVPL